MHRSRRDNLYHNHDRVQPVLAWFRLLYFLDVVDPELPGILRATRSAIQLSLHIEMASGILARGLVYTDGLPVSIPAID